MSHDLSLAQSNAFELARSLMVPVTLFQVDGAYGVMPSDELDDADVILVHEYDPHEFVSAIEPAFPLVCRLRAGGRKGGSAAAGRREAPNAPHNSSIASRALAPFALRGGGRRSRKLREKEIQTGKVWRGIAGIRRWKRRTLKN